MTAMHRRFQRESTLRPRVLILWLALSCVSAAANGSERVAALRQLQFSPDGKYLLAQDDFEIAVLTTDPFALIFRIPAGKSTLGRFTSDSKDIVFASAMAQAASNQVRSPEGTPLVERWSVLQRSRAAAWSVPQLLCGTAELAPGGRTFVCADLGGTLRVVDVPSGQVVFTKKKFAKTSSWVDDQSGEVGRATLGTADIEFSPDGRFLLAVPWNVGTPLIWDTHERALLKMRGKINEPAFGTRNFGKLTFLGSSRLAVVRGRYLRKAMLWEAQTLTFPDGHLLAIRQIPSGPGCDYLCTQPLNAAPPIGRTFRLAADPEWVIIRYVKSIGPASDHGGGSLHVIDLLGHEIRNSAHELAMKSMAVKLSTGLVIPSDSASFDIFNNRYVEEVRPGEVGLLEIGKGLQTSVVVSKR